MLNTFLFIVLCLSWGSTWVAIKVGVTTVPPLFFAGTRFIAAGLLILIVTAALRGAKVLVIARQDILPLTLMSAMVVSICFALIFWGEQFISASVTAIVVQGMIPLFLPLFAFILAGESLSFARVSSIILGIVGIACIFTPGISGWAAGSTVESSDNFETLGLIAIIVGTLAYCYGSVWGRPLLARNSGVAIAGWQNLLGGVLVLLACLVLEIPSNSATDFKAIFAPDVLFAWVWLVMIGSGVGFVLYIVLLKAWGASKVSPYAFATPLVAIILDFLLFDKLIGQWEVMGMLIIFTALGFAFYRPRSKANAHTA